MKSNLDRYTYSFLRYIHDTTSGEFINVGIVLHSKKQNFIGARFLKSVGRITNAFPGAHGHKIRKFLNSIQRDFENNYSSKLGQLPFEKFENALDISRRVLPLDHSSFQWTENKAGVCVDASGELGRMFDRFIGLYSKENVRKRRDENDIWKKFSTSLKARNLDHYFTTTTITTDDDEHEFEHAWKNGKWHCIQPISFDYTSSDYIKGKAHKWLGQVHSLRTSSSEFKLYFLIGKPSNNEFNRAYTNARSILDKMPGENLLFEENEKNKLLNLLEAEVKAQVNS